jgi:hypothetical protein
MVRCCIIRSLHIIVRFPSTLYNSSQRIDVNIVHWIAIHKVPFCFKRDATILERILDNGVFARRGLLPASITNYHTIVNDWL